MIVPASIFQSLTQTKPHVTAGFVFAAQVLTVHDGSEKPPEV